MSIFRFWVSTTGSARATAVVEISATTASANKGFSILPPLHLRASTYLYRYNVSYRLSSAMQVRYMATNTMSGCRADVAEWRTKSWGNRFHRPAQAGARFELHRSA